MKISRVKLRKLIREEAGRLVEGCPVDLAQCIYLVMLTTVFFTCSRIGLGVRSSSFATLLHDVTLLFMFQLLFLPNI